MQSKFKRGLTKVTSPGISEMHKTTRHKASLRLIYLPLTRDPNIKVSMYGSIRITRGQPTAKMSGPHTLVIHI